MIVKSIILFSIVLLWSQLTTASSNIQGTSSSDDNCESKCCISIVNGKQTANKACYINLLVKELNQCRAELNKKESDLTDVLNSINDQPESDNQLVKPYTLLIGKRNAEIEQLKRKLAEQDASLKENTMQLGNDFLKIMWKDAVIKKYKTRSEKTINKLNALQKKFDELSANTTDCKSYPTSCRAFGNSSGIQTIIVPGIEAFNVFCNSSSSAGPGWTIILRQVDYNTDFNRDWQEYRDGFGDLTRSFWLGLEKIHLLTVSQPYELYIYSRVRGYAHYDLIEIANEAESYQLKLLGKYTGNDGDYLKSFAYQKFSTRDRDNGNCQYRNCAEYLKSGWWYREYCDLGFTSWFFTENTTMMIRPLQS